MENRATQYNINLCIHRYIVKIRSGIAQLPFGDFLFYAPKKGDDEDEQKLNRVATKIQ